MTHRNSKSPLPRVLAVLALLASANCAKQGVDKTASPTGADAAQSEAAFSGVEEAEAEAPTDSPEDELAQLQSQLQAYESELDGMHGGVGGAPVRADDGDSDGAAQTPNRDKRSSQNRCERVCSIADAVCDLEGKICQLAQEHEREQRYAATCERAKNNCERASEACRGCAS